MTDSERAQVVNLIERLALSDSDKAELVRIVERLGSRKTIEAIANLKKQIGAFGIAMVKNWAKIEGE